MATNRSLLCSASEAFWSNLTAGGRHYGAPCYESLFLFAGVLTATQCTLWHLCHKVQQLSNCTPQKHHVVQRMCAFCQHPGKSSGAAAQVPSKQTQCGTSRMAVSMQMKRVRTHTPTHMPPPPEVDSRGHRQKREVRGFFAVTRCRWKTLCDAEKLIGRANGQEGGIFFCVFRK